MDKNVSKRQLLLDDIIAIVRSNGQSAIPQHVVISGDWGVGKTYFLGTVEEQLANGRYAVYVFRFPYSKMKRADEIIDLITADATGRQPILLIDDFDMLLEVLPLSEQYKLRAFLFERGAPTMIGTTTGIYPGFSDYRTPFYDAFKILHLDELEKEDLRQFLTKRQYDELDKEQLCEAVLQELGGDIDYIRSFVHWYFKHHLNPSECIEQIIEGYSKYFRLLFESLPNLQQQIILGLASIEGDATAIQIKEATHLDNPTVSSSLSRMEKKRIIQKSGQKKRNYSYRIKDKLFEQWIKRL